jgi:hypothetical protein
MVLTITLYVLLAGIKVETKAQILLNPFYTIVGMESDSRI